MAAVSRPALDTTRGGPDAAKGRAVSRRRGDVPSARLRLSGERASRELERRKHVMPAHLRERAEELDASPRAQRVAIFTQLSNSLITRPTSGRPGMFNSPAGSAGAAEKEFPQNRPMEPSDWSRA